MPSLLSQKSIQENGYKGPLGVFSRTIKDAQAYQNGKEKGKKFFPYLFIAQKRNFFENTIESTKHVIKSSSMRKLIRNKQ